MTSRPFERPTESPTTRLLTMLLATAMLVGIAVWIFFLVRHPDPSGGAPRARSIVVDGEAWVCVPAPPRPVEVQP